MANYGLLEGLGAALQGFGKIGLAQWDREQQQAEDEKKMRLKMTLDKELMQAKLDFMKQNPRYRQYFTDLSGNRIGVDEFGNEKMVHQASADERKEFLRQKDLADQYKQAQITAALDRGAAAGATAGTTNRKNNAIAAWYEAGRPGAGGAKKDQSILTPAQYENEVDKRMKRLAGETNFKDLDPSDPDDAKTLAGLRSQAEDSIKSDGYSKGFQKKPTAGGSFGVFSGAPGLAAPADDGTGDGGEDDDESAFGGDSDYY